MTEQQLDEIPHVEQCSICHQNRQIPHYGTLRVDNEVSHYPICKDCGIELSRLMDAFNTDKPLQKQEAEQ